MKKKTHDKHCASGEVYTSSAAECSVSPRKTMALMRGLPCCGKSHTSRKLVEAGGVRLEFDEYFHTQVGVECASYDWSRGLMPDARRWNVERIIRAVDAGESPIIVDSDNVPGPYTRTYVAHAVDRGYEILFKEPESSWWQTIRELLTDKQANAKVLCAWAQALTQMSKRTHRVALEDMLSRINRWEDASVERIMAVA